MWTIIHSFRIQDLFDIAIVSLLVYGLLIRFRKTASRFVMAGISLLGAVYVLSRFFQLYVTAMVLQGFFAILLVALVVIFQEDLRRFFERLAMWSQIRKKPAASVYQHAIEILAESVINLARKRIGALIVIQGEEPLDRHLEGGTPLDGLLSLPLLESVFDPHSAGHDGAAVIYRGRVDQFGCHLPLSIDPQKFGMLGLRHTAALGLSERSDALCIVVSEERGTISAIQEERYDIIKGEEDLKRILDEFYAKESPRTARGRNLGWLKENFREKAAAIALACVLWLLFGYQKESIRRDFVVPVEYRNLAAGWLIEEPKIMEAQVMLMGPEQAFLLLDSKTLRISVDLSDIDEGKQTVMLNRDMIRLPSNVSLEGIKPEDIQIVAYRLLEREVPIEVNLEGSPPAGLTLETVEVVPPSVDILVPSTMPGEETTVRTEPIGLEQLADRRVFTPRLVLPPEARFAGGKPPTVRVTIELRSSPAKVPLKESPEQ